MNNEDIKGYLKKKKSSAFKRLISNTNLRWFELRFKNEIFTYKKSKSDEQYEKKFSFNSITNVTTELTESDTKMSSWKYGFKIVFKDHEMILFSESKRDRMMWLNGFRVMFQMVRNPAKETNMKTHTVINEEINRKKEVKKENEVIKEIKNERKEEEEGDEEEEDDEGEDEEGEEEEDSEKEESESKEKNDSNKEKDEEYEKRIKEEEKKEKEKKLQAISKALKIDTITDNKDSSKGNSTKRENNQMFIINEESPKPTVREQDEVKRTNEQGPKMVQQIKFSDDSPRPIIKLIQPEIVKQSNKDNQSSNKDIKSKKSSQPSKKKDKKDISKESSSFHQSLPTESHKQSIQSKPIINDSPKESNQPSIKETHHKQSKHSSKKEIKVKVQNPIIPPKIEKPMKKESKEKIVKSPSLKNTIRSKSQNVFPSMIDNHSIHSIYTPEQDSIIQSAISDIIENNDLFTNHFESSIFTSDSFIHNSSNNSSMLNCNDNDLDDWNFYDDDKKLIAENDLINFNPLSNRIETKKLIKAKKRYSNKEAITELNKNNIKSFKEPIYISTSNTENEDKKANSKNNSLKEAKNTSFELINKKSKSNNQKHFSTNGKKYKNSIVKALEKENERKYTNINNTSIKKVDIYSMNKQKKEEPNIDNFIYKKHIIGVSNKIEDDLYSFGSKNTNNPYNVF